MERFYSFMLMGVEQSINANDEQQAKQLILLRMCNIDVSNGYFEEDLTLAKKTQLGALLWAELEKTSPFRDTVINKHQPYHYDVIVRKLEWNHYTLRIDALSEHQAEQKADDMIRVNDFKADMLTKANAEVYHPGSYNGTKVISTKQIMEQS